MGDFDSRASWMRLAVLVMIGTIGTVGLWSVVVTLPAVQAEFAVPRGAASLPYTLTMAGVAIGSVIMGRSADRLGVAATVGIGAVSLGAGYVLAGFASSLWQYTVLHGALIGMLGTAACFGPLMTEASQWFLRRRGLAVSICAAGSYVAGAVWPGVIAHFAQTSGWRATEIGIGVFCTATMLPLSLLLRGARPNGARTGAGGPARVGRDAPPDTLGLTPGGLMLLLVVAGLCCCVAMSMPQVHIVAYCGDLGYGPAQGAQMLGLMLGCGIVSRVASGWIADRIGGLPTLLLGSLLQAGSLALYLGFDSLGALYAISALFGLVQGGLVPCYAIIVRECFPAEEAGTRFGWVLMATLLGMALGGWLSGAIFDLTGAYGWAFTNGVAWNAVNAGIAGLLVLRQRGRVRPAYA